MCRCPRPAVRSASVLTSKASCIGGTPAALPTFLWPAGTAAITLGFRLTCIPGNLRDCDAGVRCPSTLDVIAMPEYVGPVLAAGGPVALVLVALRFGSDAVVRVVAGVAAVLTRDKDRGERCLKVLRILRGKDDSPPSLPDGSSLWPTGHRHRALRAGPASIGPYRYCPPALGSDVADTGNPRPLTRLMSPR